jgi:iron complex transport system permease protein
MIRDQENAIETRYLKRVTKWLSIIFILLACLFFSTALSSMIGPMPISVEKSLGIISRQIPILGSLTSCNWTPQEEIVITQLRLPRALSAVLVGIALSIAGVVFQGIFRNPMADPYVLGIASGAGFGASLALVFGISLPSISLIYTIPAMASIGALSTVFLVYVIARTSYGIPVLRLLLAGIAVSSFFSSLITVLLVIAGEEAHAVFSWLFGGFPIVEWGFIDVTAPIILLCSIIIYAYARDLNIMLLGEEQAQQLGVEVENVKKRLIILASIATAAAVSVSGIIGFVGLIVPHIMRIVVGPDHRILIPLSALAGAILLTLCDIVARIMLRPIVLPTGIVTSMLGAPFFIYLVVRSGKPKRG